MPRIPKYLRNFFALEASSAISLFVAAILAVICVNSSLGPYYEAALHKPINDTLSAPVILWINDGLMAIFFFLVGMEIKRESVTGQLSSVKKALLPAVAAIGGVVLPATIYAWLNWGNATALRGWAIPSATDIAFAIGVLALFGSRIPSSLKVFLLAVAVYDDLVAILIIAIFYTAEVSLPMLGYAAAALACLFVLGRIKCRFISLYLICGAVMWFFVLKSGVHATIAGVLLGLMMPLKVSNNNGVSLLSATEHALHPWVAFGILPIFAFANAGISFEGLSLESLAHPIPLGIVLGLFVGKQIGIFSATWLMVKSGLAPKPESSTWMQIYGVSIVAGIGFTMSLFIGGLAFSGDKTLIVYKTLGVIVGSLLSGIVGYIILHMATRGGTKKTQ